MDNSLILGLKFEQIIAKKNNAKHNACRIFTKSAGIMFRIISNFLLMFFQQGSVEI